MDKKTWKRIEDLFNDALDRPAQERLSYVKSACANEPEILREVVAMLEAHEDDHRLQIEKRLADSSSSPSADDLLGSIVGPYRLVKWIAGGGMGDVYLAEREAPYRQQVAIKLMRSGLAVKDAALRFKQERQILARLTHQNITQILDGGVDEGGRPFLALQYVEGKPITEYCREHNLSIPERLRLFTTVCSAVSFAHRHLVVHRDLKPANILVTAGGEVKLLDFGIAKPLDPVSLDLESVQTADYRPMTLEYAAPEQIRSEAITTATDIYALGILLYELLSDRKPFIAEGITRAELERRICHEDPPSTSSAPELDHIVFMALRKEPERRYASVEQLSADIGHFLADEPVLARPDTFGYRARKFVKRNAVAVGTASVGLILILSFTTVTLLQSRQLQLERDLARNERNRSEQVVRILVNLFETSNPEKVAGGNDLRVGEFLQRGIPQVLTGLQNQPDTQAKLKLVLAEMHNARSEFSQAKTLADEALAQFRSLGGADSPDAAEAFHMNAFLTFRMKGDKAAQPLMRESLAQYRRIFAPGDARMAKAMQDLSVTLPNTDERRKLLEDALAILRKTVPEPIEEIASILNDLAIYSLNTDQNERAETLFNESLTTLKRIYPETNANALDIMHNLSATYLRDDKLDLAEQTSRRLLDLRTAAVGPESVDVAGSLNILTVILATKADYEGSMEFCQRAIALWTKLLGPAHFRVANEEYNEAKLLQLQGRMHEALPVMQRAYEKYKQNPGPIDTLFNMQGQLGYMLDREGRTAEGLKALRESLNEFQKLHPDGHKLMADTQVALGQVLLRRGLPKEAEPLFRRALDYRLSHFAKTHHLVAGAQVGLASALAAQHRYQEAAPLFQEGFDRYRDHPDGDDSTEVEQARAYWTEVSQAVGIR